MSRFYKKKWQLVSISCNEWQIRAISHKDRQLIPINRKQSPMALRSLGCCGNLPSGGNSLPKTALLSSRRVTSCPLGETSDRKCYFSLREESPVALQRNTLSKNDTFECGSSHQLLSGGNSSPKTTLSSSGRSREGMPQLCPQVNHPPLDYSER